MTDVTVVGLLSLYREGRLARLAVQSVLDADLDAVFVCEGMAGAEKSDAATTNLGLLFPRKYPAYARNSSTGGNTTAPVYSSYSWSEGEWKSDAEKLTAMTKAAREHFPASPLWGVWIAGDEVLVGGEYLRDLLQRVQWDDEAEGRTMLEPDNFPTVGVPLRTVEHDGSVGIVKARCVRLDLIRRYVVSSHVLELVTGQTVTQGTMPESASKWVEPRIAAYQPRDQMFLMPPLPGEPFTIHRSHLRHPARQALRMHRQEHDELVRLGLPTS